MTETQTHFRKSVIKPLEFCTIRPCPLARGVPGGEGGQAAVPDRHPDRQSRPRREAPVKGESINLRLH